MKKETSDRLLAAAIQIGDQLLAQAERQPEGLSWRSLERDEEEEGKGLVWKRTETLSTGAAGVALYLLELFRHTRRPEYLEAAREGLRWAEARSRSPDGGPRGVFYMGSLGVAYALARLHQLTGDGPHLERALALAAEPPSPGTDEHAEVLYGLSGRILGLLQLHSLSREPWLVEAAEACAQRLAGLAHCGPAGLFWDRSRNMIGGLCGFAHGASGVAFALLELGRYLGQPEWFSLAEQAFEYEALRYDERLGNWLDLRKGVWSHENYEERKGAFLAGDVSFFTEPFETVAWCNGAGGIGLARLRAHELLGEPRYLAEAERALTRSRRDLEGGRRTVTATLCHGGGGLCELLLEAALTLGREEERAAAEAYALHVLAVRERAGFYRSGLDSSRHEDLSLFSGNAGIGYFFLRVLDPQGTPSVLAPRALAPGASAPERVAPRSSRFTWSAGHRQVLARAFPRTVRALEATCPEPLARHLATRPEAGGTSLPARFEAFVEALLPTLAETPRERLEELLALERTRVRLDAAIPSYSFLYMQSLVAREQATELLRGRFRQARLKLAPGGVLVSTRWNWSTPAEEAWRDNLQQPAEEWNTLLLPRAEAVHEELLPDFCHAVFSAFEQGATLDDVTTELARRMELETDEERGQLAAAVVEQVREAVNACILIEDPGVRERAGA